MEALLKAAEFSREADTRDRRRFVRRRPTALRDRAIILILLNTGMRASELCAGSGIPAYQPVGQPGE